MSDNKKTMVERKTSKRLSVAGIGNLRPQSPSNEGAGEASDSSSSKSTSPSKSEKKK